VAARAFHGGPITRPFLATVEIRMGKRNRGAGRMSAPSTDYRDAEGNVLTLRGSMSPLTRRKYASTLHDQKVSTDDSWHRAVEFLFERLVERWEVFGVPTEGQAELLARYRIASPEERRWIRDVLREHLAEHFPDVEAP
jgi:hypothetical protein